mmetsp:Transcript_4301/g.6373  ORF Transcript_4301/g.6373 Transcript_4301/m.6373 type:complete len:89 (+) Transcript_4301:27-293(+)
MSPSNKLKIAAIQSINNRKTNAKYSITDALIQSGYNRSDYGKEEWVQLRKKVENKVYYARKKEKEKGTQDATYILKPDGKFPVVSTTK